MERTILHCDCNSFFASVETVFCPELASVPMAVAGDGEMRHGIILAKNELAKGYGVLTAETIFSAKKKCPSLVLVPPHHEKYAEYSARVRRIYERYTDLVEPFGMDEAWLDVTASRSLFGDGFTIADEIRRTVKDELGITVSVGVSFNKVFAKMGSDYKKPDAVTVIDRSSYKEMLYHLPVETLLFVGAQTASALRASNIHTIGDLAEASPAFLRAKLGKAGETLSLYARGEDNSPVADIYGREDAKSVGNGMTFRRDLITRDELKLGLYALAEDVAHRLKKKKQKCTTVSITVKDPSLRSFTRQRPIDPPTDLSREIAEAAYAIALDAVPQGKAVRMLTVTAMNLVHADDVVEQIGFFDTELDRRRRRTGRLESAVENIRLRFGKGALTSGAVIGNDIGIQGATDTGDGKSDYTHDQNTV